MIWTENDPTKKGRKKMKYNVVYLWRGNLYSETLDVTGVTETLKFIERHSDEFTLSYITAIAE